jgi:hypothetical protein
VTTAGGKSLELLAKEWPCFEGDVDSPWFELGTDCLGAEDAPLPMRAGCGCNPILISWSSRRHCTNPSKSYVWAGPKWCLNNLLVQLQ